MAQSAAPPARDDSRLRHSAARPVARPRSGRTAVIACGALAQGVADVAARRGWRSTCTRSPAAAQPPRAASRPRSRRWPPSWPTATTASSSATPTAAPTAPSTRSVTGAGSPGWPGCTATTSTAGPTGWPAGSSEQPGTYVLTDFLVLLVRPHRAGRAGSRPPPGAARRLLRPLHPGGLAGAASDRRPASACRRAAASSACRCESWRSATRASSAPLRMRWDGACTAAPPS